MIFDKKPLYLADNQKVLHLLQSATLDQQLAQVPTSPWSGATPAKIGSLQLADQKPHIQSLNAAHSASLTSTKPGWTCSPLVRHQPGQAGRQQRATFRPQLTARQQLSLPLILSCRRDSHIGLPTCEHCTMRKFIHLLYSLYYKIFIAPLPVSVHFLQTIVLDHFVVQIDALDHFYRKMDHFLCELLYHKLFFFCIASSL